MRKCKIYTCITASRISKNPMANNGLRGPELETHPRTLIPPFLACIATFRALVSATATLQFVFFRLKPSEAEMNTAISFTPLCIASSIPLAFGTSTGRRKDESSKRYRTPSMTRFPSASCGIHFGDTKEVISTVEWPQDIKRFISSIFTSVETILLIFCSPSRGPTSTIRTGWREGMLLGYEQADVPSLGEEIFTIVWQ